MAKRKTKTSRKPSKGKLYMWRGPAGWRWVLRAVRNNEFLVEGRKGFDTQRECEADWRKVSNAAYAPTMIMLEPG